PSFNTSGVRVGSMLTQTYTITNPSATATVNFELVRYMDSWIKYDGSLIDGGGRLVGPPETLFETEGGGGSTSTTTFVGITALAGTATTTNRFEIDTYPALRSRVIAGNILDDIVTGDGNGNGFIDLGSEYDVTRAMRNTFSLAPLANTTYVTHTIFGDG